MRANHVENDILAGGVWLTGIHSHSTYHGEEGGRGTIGSNAGRKAAEARSSSHGRPPRERLNEKNTTPGGRPVEATEEEHIDGHFITRRIQQRLAYARFKGLRRPL